MNKKQFKSSMSEFRKLVSSASWKGKSEFNAAMDSCHLCASCLRPRYQQIVSRSVMLHIYAAGGLDAVKHIDMVEIKYN